MPDAWNRREIERTVERYFALLDAQLRGEDVVKAEIYRQLHAEMPQRSAKAFEYKFQNISAVLHELQRPYCDGLKPKFNYQAAIRRHVLDRVEADKLPIMEPRDILRRRLLYLQSTGPHQVAKTGTGRFGLAIETLLGIEQNSDKAADCMGIELKTKGGSGLQTLFSRVPSRYVGAANKANFFERHHYVDSKRDRRALYTSFGSSPDTLGFRLSTDVGKVVVLRHDCPVFEYDAEVLEQSLLTKLSRTAFIAVRPSKRDEREYFELLAVDYCEWPSVIKFMKLIESGQVHLDLTLSERAPGQIRDHGFLWRVRPNALEDLFLSRTPLIASGT